MAFDMKKFLLPPSPLFPIAGAALGYLLAPSDKEGKAWGVAAGVLLGVALNSAARSMQAQAEVAKASGATEFQASLGGELLNSGMGKPTYPAKAITAGFVGASAMENFGVGRPSIRQEMNRSIIFPVRNNRDFGIR